ncbi:hypothetical protein L228DRAFT_227583 [Xylona heveae TC161]|uniref:Uncharacterized protein n=1 Tax=Xylona heveae (strain CBS 132557 / TC161) TaxID=1328760 RepID=A0A165J3H5_XYLHT|nr:hypothetical protein L228DRAFT_227583 [Xylona heveae TC161]KZF25680.1 hypothetical protein L228DRAFT_227583 [Xylona heveae TC161]
MMADSPAVQAPIDPREQPILDKLLAVRDNLSLLKQDRTTYIRSQDVMSLYDQVIEQVLQLNDVRKDNRSQQSRVDTVLDDCFQLISLFFLTIGKNNEAPAVYSMTSTIKRLLDHLKEAAFYSAKDLDSMSGTLESLRENLRRGSNTYPPELLTLLEARLTKCESLLHELQKPLWNLPASLTPIHEKLVSILRLIAAANTRQKFPAAEVKSLQEQLWEIQGTQTDGKFVAPDGTIPEGQEVVLELFGRCLKWAGIVLEREGRIDERVQPTYARLLDIRNQLEKLSLTQAWSLRETDLYGFQRQLDRIDEARVNGEFVDHRGEPADLHAQRTLLYLLRRSYAYIYVALISSEPVSEALLPIFNQLQTLRKCLIEVRESGGVSSPRELYPYSMKLNSIDNMRVDGKFMVGNDIPEGQGSINSLLAECFDLCYELRVDIEDKESKE